MMDCIQAIRARRSIRKFKPGGAIPKADLEQMLEAAMLAPSACNTRPWEFYVVENPEVKARLSASHPYAKMLDTASASIVVCARPEAQEGICQGYWPLDCGAAVENLLLQAAGLGYGTCWCGCWPSQKVVDALRAVLDTVSVPVALISVGVPDEEPLCRGYYDPKKVTWVR